MEQLLDHALVRLDDATQFLSLHRLVQAEYLFQAALAERQEAFEAATTLLLEAFPHVGQGRIIDSDRSRGELYIQHVLSLIFNFSKETHQPNAIRPTRDFLELIGDCSWFVIFERLYTEAYSYQVPLL
jgi:hypothetical protein